MEFKPQKEVNYLELKKPYDAMVFIKGSEVIAVDSEGTKIASGTAGTDDATVIQAAIDTITCPGGPYGPVGGGSIYVSSGEYHLSSSLIIDTSYVTFRGDGKDTQFVMDADATALILTPITNSTPANSVIGHLSVGGFQIVTYATQTEPAVKIVCSFMRSVISDIRVYSTVNTYDAFEIKTESTGFGTAMVFVSFENIHINTCNRGFNFNIDRADGWYNANIFRGITIEAPVIGFDFTEALGGLQIIGNSFSDVQIQATAVTTFGFKNVWATSNEFNAIYVWDWIGTPGTYWLSFAVGSSKNMLVSADYQINEYVIDYGYRNLILGPENRPIRSNNAIVVSSWGGDYTTISGALAGITDASSSNRYTIYVFGVISETSKIVLKDYIDIVGYNAVVNITLSGADHTITCTGIHTKIKDVKFVANGTYAGSYYTLYLSASGAECEFSNCTFRNEIVGGDGGALQSYYSTPTSFVFENCTFESTAASGGPGIKLIGHKYVFKNCKFNITTTDGIAFYFFTTTNLFIGCEIFAGSRALRWYDNCSGIDKFINCDIISGLISSGSDGIYTVPGNSPKFTGCNIWSGLGTACYLSGGFPIFDSCDINSGQYHGGMYAIYSSTNARGIFRNCSITAGRNSTCSIQNNSETQFENCDIGFTTYPYYFAYTGASYEFVPFASYDYSLLSIAINVTVAVGGATISIGTTDGGTEIGSVSAATTGNKNIVATFPVDIPADGIIYIKPSDIAVRFYGGYTVAYNHVNPVIIATGFGKPTFNNCDIVAGSSAAGVYMDATSLISVSNCNIDVVGLNYSINCSGARLVYAYGCNLKGITNNIVSFPPNANNSGIGAINVNLIRPEMNSILELLGDARLLLPQVEITGTSITDYTRRANTCTASTSVETWYGFQGRATYYDYNGTSYYLYRADDADFTFGNSLVDSAFSVVALVSPDDVTGRTIIGKWDETAAAPLREWRLYFDASGYPTFVCYDESVDKYIGRQDQTAFATTANLWRVIIVTYSGSATCAGIKIYIDGVQLDDADVTDAGYVAMEDLGSQLYVGCKFGAAARDTYYDGKLTWPCVTAKELSADEAWAITQRLKGVLGI
jgi:hypothetical protein